MSDMKKRLDFYGGGYQKGQFHAGTLLLLALVLSGLLTFADPLGLSGFGTYTSTDAYVRCDTGAWNANGDLIGYFCRKAQETVTYGGGIGHAFAAVMYTLTLVAGFVLILMFLSPHRAMDRLAHKLAAAKTLGLLEDDKE